MENESTNHKSNRKDKAGLVVAGVLAGAVVTSAGCLEISKVAQVVKTTDKVVLVGISKVVLLGINKVGHKVVSRVAMAVKTMNKVVLLGITVLHQTFKTVAGMAAHPTKVVNTNLLAFVSS